MHLLLDHIFQYDENDSLAHVMHSFRIELRSVLWDLLTYQGFHASYSFFEVQQTNLQYYFFLMIYQRRKQSSCFGKLSLKVITLFFAHIIFQINFNLNYLMNFK